MNFAKALGFIFIAVIFLYLGVAILVHYLAEKIIFQPQPSSYRDTNQIIKLNSSGVPISAIHLHNPKAHYTILFSHGNAEDIGHILPTLEKLKAMGFSVFAYDYQGYGTSLGSPTEENAQKNVEVAYNYLIDKLNIPADRIIAYGRSLGGAVAVDLAQKHPLGGLIVESSFVTAYRIVTKISLFPFDKFKSISKIKQVHCPILVIHRKKDEVIPFSHGEKLFLEANEPKLSYWVEEAGHNNLLRVATNGYEKTLLDFVGLIEKNRKDELKP